MAARLTARQSETTRAAIQSTRMINKLQCKFFREDWEGHGVPELDAQDVAIGMGLLKKTIPDQKVMEMGLDEDTLTSLAIYKGNAPRPADDKA
jgi:hypothetical protein